MTKLTPEEQSLTIEHDSLNEIAKEEHPRSERANFIDYLEGFYVGDFTPFILQNLRFYKRKKGKRAGRFTAIYVNPKTGKGMSGSEIIRRYLENPNPKHEPPISLRQRINDAQHIRVDMREHIYEHIVFKLKKNQKQTIARLQKEKERNE